MSLHVRYACRATSLSSFTCSFHPGTTTSLTICLLRYIGHVLRMPADKMVRCALMALVSDSVMYPTGSLFSDSGRCAVTTCGNGGESCNVARQSGVAVVNLRCFKVISCTTIVP